MNHRRDIEGLRAVALMSVLLYHAGVPHCSGGYVGVDAFFVISGFLIIGLLWRELSSTGTVSLRSFYARRARRLLPAAVVVIVATVLASWRLLSPLRSASVARDGLASAFYVVNHRLAGVGTDYLDAGAPPSPLQHYWSLSVEEQFYLVVPIAIITAWIVSRRHRSTVRQATMRGALISLASVGGVSFVMCLRMTSSNQRLAFFLLPTRAWEFVVGGLIAVAGPRLRDLKARTGALLASFGIALFLWSAVSYNSATAFPGAAAALPVLGIAAVITAGCTVAGTAVNRIIAMNALTGIGRISYSWYLWHWPVLVLAPVAAGHRMSTGSNVLLVLASGGLAAITTRLVEDPVRYSPRLIMSRRKTLGLSAALSLTAAGCTLVVAQDAATLPRAAAAPKAPSLIAPTGVTAASTTAPPRTEAVSSDAAPAATTTTAAATTTTVDPVSAALAVALQTERDAIAAGATTLAVPSNLTPKLSKAHADKAKPFADGCFASFGETGTRDCHYGNVTGTTRIALFGDSHAAAWFPAVEASANERGWALDVYSKATCPPMFASVWNPGSKRHYGECDTWRAAVMERLQAAPPSLVVLAANRAYGDAYRLTTYGPEWLQGLAQMVSQLTALGSRVLVLGPVPLPPDDVPECLSKGNPVDQCSPSAGEPTAIAGIAAEQGAVSSAGGSYLDVRPLFCAPAACDVIVGDMLLYRDQNHLTTTFSGWLAPIIGLELDAAIAGAPVGA